jgi:hypothetical protein
MLRAWQAIWRAPNLLNRLKCESKVKTTEEQGFGARSLACSILEGRRACWNSGMGTRMSDKHQLFTRTCTNQTTSWLMHFGARTNHGQTQIHKTHHDPDLREATTFPLIVYSVLLHKAHIQMAFCLKTPKWESQNSQSWDSMILGPHNFVFRPAIGTRSKAKL